VIDALLSINAQETTAPDTLRRSVLITTHRRESFGEPLARICAAIARLAEAYPDVDFRLPMHPNPNVRSVVQSALKGRKNVILSEPMDYRTFVRAMAQAHLVLTDSGGVQEEAPALGKPVLVLRKETERTESVDHGVAKLVGTGEEEIVSSVSLLLDDDAAWRAMAKGVSPYGDGHASERIANAIRRHFQSALAPSPDPQR
jgi:UDP-N-acetylglucosamine 2-epimerase (non-hydrolysing)